MENDMAGKKTKDRSGSGADNDERPLEELFSEVEEKIGSLENDDLSLEESFERYKAGMELLRACSARIDRTEKKVLEIEEDGSTKPFTDETDGEN